MTTNIEKERAIKLLKNLITINTVNPPGNEKRLATELFNYARHHGLKADIQNITGNRANIIITLEGKDKSLPPLILSGHLDTVSIGNENKWSYPPLSGELVEEKMYGRGTSDMKGGVAALIEAMIRLKTSNTNLNNNVIFIGTSGEEVDCIGAREVVKSQKINDIGAMIIAEPTDNQVYVAHKGALWIEVEVLGKSAHGSMVEEGENAVEFAANFISTLKDKNKLNYFTNDLLGQPTISVNKINGGNQTNVIPDNCSVVMDIRTIPEIEHYKIVGWLEKVLQRMKIEKRYEQIQWKIKVIKDLKPIKTESDNAFVQAAIELNESLFSKKSKPKGANYYTDGSIYFEKYKKPIIIYGPGYKHLAHKENESIDINNYLDSIVFYKHLINKYSEMYEMKGEAYKYV